ncbi:unnamed protein product [Cyprideis torosa]|uniref:Uncharacterized protein n=1 Tax=Cyprideis torosa TaxID=163714 RepID=A0A7R8ZWL0_9CRUS|nr:unnamed protein product [Cyprideis torosa]CAG0905464.1 unnamed protein product [Cyprideis torosa]
MFSDQWVEAEKDVIPIEQFSYAVYYAFIKYLYIDTLDLNVEDAIGVLDLANAYCDESLKMKCIRFLRNGITVDNAAHLYSIAIRYHAPELEDFAFNFCIHHMTKITQTEAFSGMEKDIIVAFVVKAGNHGAFKH